MALREDMDGADLSVSGRLLRNRPVWGPFIGGSFLIPDDAETFEVLEAVNGSRLALMVAASDEMVDLAVIDSRRAYEQVWRHVAPKERGALMREVAVRIRAHADELAELVAREVGKPKRDALRVDVVSSHSSFDYYAGITENIHGEILDQGLIEARVVYEPYGVVAAILPFNWPPIHFSKKCAPALAAGNTIVLKPDDQTPLTLLELARAAAESPIAFLPGIATASEAMTLMDYGFTALKFFPAEAAGGVKYLSSIGGPLADLRFCPTGGIDAEKAKTYLALKNVVCVGGSWMLPASALESGDYGRIELLAREASALKA